MVCPITQGDHKTAISPPHVPTIWCTSAHNGWNLLASLGHRSKFQRVSSVAFVSAATSLNGGQPNFARCLAVSWPGTLYTFLGALALTEFCKVQNSLYVQVLRFPILAALLRGIRVRALAKLCGVEQRAPPTFGRPANTLVIRPRSSSFCFILGWPEPAPMTDFDNQYVVWPVSAQGVATKPPFWGINSRFQAKLAKY